MNRLFAALTVAGLAATATLTAPVSAGAAGSVNLHNVNLHNATIPGRTCFKSSPIHLHNGHGAAGHKYSQQVTADATGKPIYGDLTGDGGDEAVLYVACRIQGGMDGYVLKRTAVVFSGRTGQVRTLGLIRATHQFLNAEITVFGKAKIANQQVRLPERVYLSTDAACCPTQRAGTVWRFHNSGMRIVSRWLRHTDRIVDPRHVGLAGLGMTPARLHQIYGSSLHSTSPSPHCRVYWHGNDINRSFQALVDDQSGYKVFAIYAPHSATTVDGVGYGAKVKQVEGRAKKYGGYDSADESFGYNLYVFPPHSAMAFQMTYHDGQKRFVRAIRIATNTAGVRYQHTC